MKFRLKTGRHIYKDGEERKVAVPGQVIETEVNLIERFGTERFEKVSDDTPVGVDENSIPETPGKSMLNNMTVTQLKMVIEREGLEDRFAEEGITKKADMAKALIDYFHG